MRPQVLVVALDACDPDVARRFAATGRMPNLARVMERAARCRVRNPHGLFVGALWVTFSTGNRADKHGFHCWDKIDVESYVRVESPPTGDEGGFWEQLGEAGRRVAVLDVPHTKASVPVNGIHLSEWGCHDRHFGLRSWPPQRAREIDAGIGLHPLLGPDAYAARHFAPDDYMHREGPYRTIDEDRAMLDGLRRGIVLRRKLNTEILAEENWDLFITVFGESHAVGHQLWHAHDASHPRWDAELTRALGGDPIAQIYSDLDTALGETLAQADENATVLVLLSHGMGPHYDGSHLLEEVLGRLDLYHREPASKSALRRAIGSAPSSLQRHATAFVAPLIRQRIMGQALTPSLEYQPADIRMRQRFFAEPNNTVFGGIRFNVIGREPNGCVAPEDVDALSNRLREDLLSLINVETGGAAVRDVERTDRWYTRSRTDALPDLFVTWERSNQIETVWSAKTGLVHAPYTLWRSGDHRPDGLLFAFGPGIPTRTTLPVLDTEDFAPSIAARLGAQLGNVDGRVADWMRPQ